MSTVNKYFSARTRKSGELSHGTVAPAPARRFRALRRQPAQKRGLQRVTDVLNAAEKLLTRQHFDAITIENIAAAASIQIGSLYHFFEDKTAVLVSVLERALQVEADAFHPLPEDTARSLHDYLISLEQRLWAVWKPRIALLDLYYAYRRNPLIWKSVLQLRARVARDIAAKLRQLYPQLTQANATAVGEQIGISIAVLNDNVVYLGEPERRRLRRECLAMLTAYVHSRMPPAGRAAATGRR